MKLLGGWPARTAELLGAWPARTRDLHAELAALAEPAPWWWLIAAGVAFAEALPHDNAYLACDAEPDADTMIAYRSPRPRDLVGDAISRARAARIAIRELDGTLPDQPLAMTLATASAWRAPRGRGPEPRVIASAPTDHPRIASLVGRESGAHVVPSLLDVAAFAIGDRCVVARLDDPDLHANLSAYVAARVGDPDLHAKSLARFYRGLTTLDQTRETPFVCVSIGDEPLETARHGHRRAWIDADAAAASGSDDRGLRSRRRGTQGRGPWLGLARADDLAIVSTCHLVVDGYGHARLAARIAELVAASTREPKSSPTLFSDAPSRSSPALFLDPPSLSRVRGAVPLSIASRELDTPLPRVIPLVYRLGCMLQRDVGRVGARFSPTVQVPVALGAKDDPLRLRRRVVAASTCVRFDERGEPEPFAVFEARVRDVFAREAMSRGLVSRLLAAGRAVPAPLRWKRQGISAKRPAWLEGFAGVIGGRAMLSRISLEPHAAGDMPRMFAVSSPSRLASEHDAVGGCVITIVDDGTRGAITLSGSGTLAVDAILDELLDDVRAAAARRA